jgi:hypothetical protein
MDRLMEVNKSILIGGIVIISVGAVYAIVKGRPETPVFAGGVGFLLLASLLDVLGGGFSKLATALVGLATVSVIIVESPTLFSALQTAQSHQTTKGTA